jgi:hypothetical protein
MNAMIANIIMVCLGFMVIAAVLVTMSKQSSLRKKGVRAQGVVFDVEDQIKFNTQSATSRLRYPTIRFLTDKDEWIMERSKIGGTFKTGQKVVVIYDPEDPRRFMIESKTVNILLPCIGIIGLVFLVYGLYRFLM